MTPEQQALLDTYKTLGEQLTRVFGTPPPAVISPAPEVPIGVPQPKYLYNTDNNLLRSSRGVAPTQVGNYRIDPFIEADCPTGVKVPSGSVLSVARPDLGESFIPYVARVSTQACGPENEAINTLGVLFLGGDYLFNSLGGFKEDGSNWPFAADRFLNAWFYADPELQARADAEWAEYWRKKEEALRRAGHPVQGELFGETPL